jgi:hypothetical protein
MDPKRTKIQSYWIRARPTPMQIYHRDIYGLTRTNVVGCHLNMLLYSPNHNLSHFKIFKSPIWNNLKH